MSEPKFKVGDRVVHTNHFGVSVIGEVICFDYDGNPRYPYCVRVNTHQCAVVSESSLSKVPTETPVNLVDNPQIETESERIYREALEYISGHGYHADAKPAKEALARVKALKG